MRGPVRSVTVKLGEAAPFRASALQAPSPENGPSSYLLRTQRQESARPMDTYLEFIGNHMLLITGLLASFFLLGAQRSDRYQRLRYEKKNNS